jgi:LPXTG-site transpeptidase (sortase) family protein
MLDFFRLVPKKRTVKIKSKNGVIFSNPGGLKKKIFHLGTVIFLTATIYLIYLYWPLAKSITAYKMIKEIRPEDQKTKEEEIEQMEIVVEEKINEFVIKIPKIGAEAEVKTNVSPFDKKEYLAIIENDLVAHAKETALPGEKDEAMYLFAHSTRQGIQMVRKNSVFYLLGELRNDDPIFIKYNGKVYAYKVYDQKVVGAQEVEYLNYKEKDREVLILQTCWPLGTDWKRLLIFAERI